MKSSARIESLHIYAVAEKRARIDDDSFRKFLVANATAGLITACKPVTFDHRSVYGSDVSERVVVVAERQESSRMLKGKV